MPKFSVKEVKKYDFLTLMPYLSIRWQAFIKERKRSMFEEFSIEDIAARHYNFLLDDKIIGIARVITRDDRLELGRIAIKEEYRNNGYGKKFVEQLILEIRNIKQDKIMSLFVIEKSLIKFYQQFGFIENGEVYFGDKSYVNMIRSV